ncbi:nucleotidyltransferase domain-containing protein [Candidatus Woesearchaeota archaeon]|nr:nucleotidyltransferase domain-containing protein [Candidatus Woesearchaeota archaeon]MBW3016414.1 nucleotidyltransferase domain-containing protein [Candidatus Woesearchaeota archaeon]
MRYQPIFKSVLKYIVPSKEERARVLKEVNLFLSMLNKELKRNKFKAVAVLGGSYSKDNWLSGDYDVDVFVKFGLVHNSQNLSDLLEKALKNWDFERIHGSRDYFWVRNSIKYEIIPVLDIKKPSEAENVTDFSPWHVAWVNKNGKNLKDDIRLAKKFCKANNCYGAESYIRGFSGHVLDILVIYYKGFLPFLKAACKWKPKVVIDYNKVYKGKALLMMNKSKTEGPLVLVDPVQPGRNSAAALTQENFDRFVVAARKFLKKPSVDFFVERPVDFESLRKKGHLLKVAVRTLDDKEDVAGAKFVRAFEYLKAQLADFVVKDSGWLWDRTASGLWWFLLGRNLLPDSLDWMGPPVKLKEAVKEFKKKYKKTFVRNGRVYAKVKRSERTPEEVVKRVLKEPYVKSRVRFAR